VTVEDDSGQAISYEIVLPEEVDAAKGQISLSSPIGRALISKTVGDEVVVQTPSGKRSTNHRSSSPCHQLQAAPRASTEPAATGRQPAASADERLLGGTGFEKIPVAHSMPSSWPRWGAISQCQWKLRLLAAIERSGVERHAVGRVADRRTKATERAT